MPLIESMRIALVHGQMIQGNTLYNHKVLGKGMAIATGYGAQLILTGELQECGAEFWKKIQLPTIPCATYPYLESLKEMTYKYQIDVVLGRAERDNEAIYSTYTYIGRTGNIYATHRKCGLETTEETRYLAEANELTCIEVNGIKIGLLLGYSTCMTEWIEAYKKQNADLIVCGVNPIHHCNLGQEVRQLEKAYQPIVFCNYDLETFESTYRGESICLSHGEGLVFKPSCDSIILLDYQRMQKKFKLIKCIPIKEILA